MSTDRTAQARAEAERRVPARLDRGRTYPIEALDTHERNGFMQGVEWADANPQPHTITREEAREAWLSGEDFGDFADALKAAGIEMTDDAD